MNKKSFIRRISLILVTFIALLLFAMNTFSQPVNDYGQLKVVGSQLQGKDGKAVILRGMSFGWHNWWPKYWNEDVVKWMVDDWKCQILRAAMGVEPPDGYINKPTESQNLLKKVVDAAIANKIYVIIDWHAHEIHQKEASAFFAEMARTYGSKPNIIYEIYNEPTDKQTWDQVKNYAKVVIDSIRKYDPDNCIIVGCPNWDQDINLVADSPLTGYSNILYSVHFYAKSHKKFLRDRCDYAISKKIPIFVSECCGTEASGTNGVDYKEWEIWINYMESKKISWIDWSISDKENETCSILKLNTSSKGGWKESDLTETGVYIRNIFRNGIEAPVIDIADSKQISAFQMTDVQIDENLRALHIQCKLPMAGDVSTVVQDISGRVVSGTSSVWHDAGTCELSVNLSGMNSGVYFVILNAGNDRVVRKIAITK